MSTATGTRKRRRSKKNTDAPTTNLFTAAGEKEKEEPKKPKGTVFHLPKDLDSEGKLTAEAARLHDAVEEVAEAIAEEKAAKNRGNAAKGVLGKHALCRYTREMAKLAVLPPGPITLVNHEGAGVTYVVQDKSQQNNLDDKQIELLKKQLGPELAAKVVVPRELFYFNVKALNEKAAGEAAEGEKVSEVVFQIVSEAIMGSNKLSDEQKTAVIGKKTKNYLAENTLQRIPELVGANAAKIQLFLETVGSAIVRYIKP